MKLVEVTALPKFHLHLRYESGESGQVDLTPMVGRGVFSAWNKPGFFEQVQLSPEGAPHWSGEIDLCPDALFMQMTGKGVADLFPSLSKSYAHAWNFPFLRDHNPLVLWGSHASPFPRLVRKLQRQVQYWKFIEGNLPPRATAMVEEWAKLHQRELRDAFLSASELKKPSRIDPLP